MKSMLIFLTTILSAPAFAASADICEKTVRDEVEKLEEANAKADSDYSFDGIGDVSLEGKNTYLVSFGFNEECQGLYELRVKPSKDGKTCTIVKTIEYPPDCG